MDQRDIRSDPVWAWHFLCLTMVSIKADVGYSIPYIRSYSCPIVRTSASISLPSIYFIKICNSWNTTPWISWNISGRSSNSGKLLASDLSWVFLAQGLKRLLTIGLESLSLLGLFDRSHLESLSLWWQFQAGGKDLKLCCYGTVWKYHNNTGTAWGFNPQAENGIQSASPISWASVMATKHTSGHILKVTRNCILRGT